METVTVQQHSNVRKYTHLHCCLQEVLETLDVMLCYSHMHRTIFNYWTVYLLQGPV